MFFHPSDEQVFLPVGDVDEPSASTLRYRQCGASRLVDDSAVACGLFQYPSWCSVPAQDLPSSAMRTSTPDGMPTAPIVLSTVAGMTRCLRKSISFNDFSPPLRRTRELAGQAARRDEELHPAAGALPQFAVHELVGDAAGREEGLMRRVASPGVLFRPRSPAKIFSDRERCPPV